MPTNLMAHHLKMLQDCGLVVRNRSEGDRRRTYVRLVPEMLNDLLPAPARTVPRSFRLHPQLGAFPTRRRAVGPPQQRPGHLGRHRSGAAIIALAFDFTNGFHDAANAIATSIRRIPDRPPPQRGAVDAEDPRRADPADPRRVGRIAGPHRDRGAPAPSGEGTDRSGKRISSCW